MTCSTVAHPTFSTITQFDKYKISNIKLQSTQFLSSTFSQEFLQLHRFMEVYPHLTFVWLPNESTRIRNACILRRFCFSFVRCLHLLLELVTRITAYEQRRCVLNVAPALASTRTPNEFTTGIGARLYWWIQACGMRVLRRLQIGYLVVHSDYSMSFASPELAFALLCAAAAGEGDKVR